MTITEELLDIVSGFEAMKGKSVETVGDGPVASRKGGTRP
jgi:hypothetical protein